MIARIHGFHIIEFCPTINCPKCSGTTKRRYCDGYPLICQGMVEHFHVTCIECGYKFYQKVKNAESPLE